MSANKSRPHLVILPEDRQNEQIANGFHLEVGRLRQLQVLPVAGGWKKVLEDFLSTHVAEMRRYSTRFMVLLFDCDNDPDRLQTARQGVPQDLRDRVFLIGVLTEPEDLRVDLGSAEVIGAALAGDCREGTTRVWGHRLLKQNVTEIDRLRPQICPILFPASR